jgi:hypothetical protein
MAGANSPAVNRLLFWRLQGKLGRIAIHRKTAGCPQGTFKPNRMNS